MSPIRKLLLVGVGVLALHGVQACAAETGADLNPQPLPPNGGGDPVSAPPSDPAKNGDGTTGAGSSGSPASPDAGADADAARGADASDASDSGAD